MNQDKQDTTVFIVDDDDAIRDSMSMLMQTIGLHSRSFASAQEFLEGFNTSQPGCLVLDIRMPGMSGLELQQELHKRHSMLPIIFVTGHGDVPMAVQAIQNGAADFIQKPFRDQDLIDRVNTALSNDAEFRKDIEEIQHLKMLADTLTPREREVMDLIVAGDANKVAAHKLGVSQRTIEIHRARVMEKMKARNLAQLVRQHLAISDEA